MKFFLKWKCAKKKILLEPLTSTFLRDFQLEGNCQRRIFLAGRGVFYAGITFYGRIICGEKKFSIEMEPAFPALFKNDQKSNKK